MPPVKLTVAVAAVVARISRGAVAEHTFPVVATPRWVVERTQALLERVQAVSQAEPRTPITAVLLTLTMLFRRTTSMVGTPPAPAPAALWLTRLDLRQADPVTVAVRATAAVLDL